MYVFLTLNVISELSEDFVTCISGICKFLLCCSESADILYYVTTVRSLNAKS